MSAWLILLAKLSPTALLQALLVLLVLVRPQE